MTATSVERWLGRPGAIAAARLLNAAFFLTVAAYCFLSRSPFAYAQFIEPNVVPALTEFVTLSQFHFWTVLLITTLTLIGPLRGGAGQRTAIAYVVVWAVVGIAVLIRPPLGTIGGGSEALVLGLVALVPPMWLAILDHFTLPPPAIRPTDTSRALVACVCSALIAWGVYAVAAPFRLSQAVGIDLTGRAFVLAAGSALIFDLYCFLALFLALASAIALAGFARNAASAEYWLFVVLLAVCAGLVLYLLVCASMTFIGWDAAVASAALALALAAIWADLARLRSGHATIDSLGAFSAPIVGVRSRSTAVAALVALPVAAYVLVDAVSHFDWNFLLQKLTVLVVWLTTFAAVCGSTDRVRRKSPSFRLALVPVVAFGLYHALVSIEARGSRSDVDRYAALDPSFRMIRDARHARSAETAEYYAFLRSNTLLGPAEIPPLDVDFVKPLAPMHGRQPDIFLFVVDSLRRDYLSPYNARVSFTPEIDRLGRDSAVFDRAFTRYSGTALAVPSIWAGGMMLHSLDQPEFGRRNALLKLLDANRYLRLMDIDHIVGDLVPADSNLVQLDKGKGTMQFDLCTTVTELEANLRSADPARPVFFYSLPQNVHISIASSRKVPGGESYPGFFAPVASSVHRLDGCIGGFIDSLKRMNRYENSIIILTSDHGDSLGEEGRWGHGHFVVPEVMRVPLIVRVPSRLRARMSFDLSAVTFTSDITPSLYALLGYEPRDLGPLIGRSAFVVPEADSAWRRHEAFLVASSYGAAYGMLRHNGRRMYVVDAVDGRDSAFDIDDDAIGARTDVTRALTETNRLLIRQQLMLLAQQNHYRPQT
jgi:sulfatase-like protein